MTSLPCQPVRTEASKIMKKTLTALAVMLGLVASAGAQTVAYTATAGTSGNPGIPAINMGHTFYVSGSGIEVFQLGFFDYQGNPLAGPHTVTLFNNETPLASVTVPAGAATNLLNGYAFTALSTPIYLPAGYYTVLCYDMDGSDPFGNGDSTGFNGSPNLSSGAVAYAWTTLGYPDYPNPNDQAYSDNGGGSWNAYFTGVPFASSSFTYTNVTSGAAATWTGGGGDNNWSTSGNWNVSLVSPAPLTFAGSTRQVNNNDLSGFTATSLTFDVAAGAFTLNGNAIALGGNIGFNGNPATPVTQTVNLNMAWSDSETIDTPTNGNLSLGGNITSGADITKIDAGTLTFGGTNTIESLDINGGTNIITGNTTLNGSAPNNYDRFYVADGDASALCKGTLIIQPGAVFSVIGDFNDSAVIGRDGGSGTVIQNGGTFIFNCNQQDLWIGATGNSATRSEYDMNGGVFDLTGHTFGVGLGAGVLITGLVNQVSGVITNVGNLWLGGATPNGLGAYSLSGGSIYIGSGGITTYSGLYTINLGGGTVAAGASWSSPLNMNLTGVNGPVTFNPAGNDITLSGALSGTGGLTVNGAGTLELSGANTYSGDTTVSAGSTLQLDVTGSSLGALRLANGSTLNLNFSGNYAVAHFYTNGVALPVGTYSNGNLSAFIAGSGNLVVSSSISTGLWTGLGGDNNWSTSGNWNQNAVPIFPIAVTFAGSTRLTNTNDLSSITASSITFDAAAGAFNLNGNAITLGGSIGFNGNPTAPITQTANLGMTFTANETIDTPTNGNLSLGGNITSANNLFKIDAGTLTLGGVDTFDGYSLNGGTNVITGSTSINGTTGHRIYLGDGDTIPGCNGTLIIQPGATFDVTGTFDDSFVIGRDGGSGTVIQNGGTLSYNCNQTAFVVGAASNPGTRAEYDMNGGLLDLNGANLWIGLGDGGITDTGVVNQVSGLINNVFGLQVGAVRSFGYGVYTLSGGSIYIGGNGIGTASGKYAINLGGGTVGAQATWSSSLNMNLTGSNGPVTFDTGAGYTITLSGVLSGNGGLIVTNGGTLDLAGTNSYTGDTTVNAATLELDVAGSSPGAFHLANGATLNLTYSGTYVVSACYTNGVALAIGVYNSGNLPGFISGGSSGSLTVAGNVSTGLWTGLGANNNWSTGNNWDHNAVPVFPIGLTFAGSTRLINNNDLSSITASSITFDAAAGAFTLGGNSIGLNGNLGFNGNPAVPVTQTVNLNMGWNASETINTPTNGNLSLGGNVTSSTDTSLIKLGAGTLTLGGTNAITSFDLDIGTNIITGNTTVNGDGGSRIYLGDGDTLAGCNGTLIIQPGAVLDVTGGFGDQFVIGRDSGSGTVIQNGGTFTFNPSSMPGGNRRMLLGATGDSRTQTAYDMNGGLLDMGGCNLSVGWGNQTGTTGTVNQVGGVITNLNEIEIPTTGGAGGMGVYTLSGGSVYLLGGGIINDSSNYRINLGGGTVGAEANWSSSLNMTLTGINGPVTFNPAGNNILLSGVLSGTGGLTVNGAGTLELSGANVYTGDTVVNAGSTLELAVPWSDPTTLRVANGSTLNLNYSGNYTVLGCYTNGVALPLGTYNNGNLPGFITGSGNLVVAATVITQTVGFTAGPGATYGGAANNGPGLNIGNTFSVSGGGIEVFQLGAFNLGGAGLNASHTVTLFNATTHAALGSVTVLAGTVDPLLYGYRFAPLSTPIYLPAGNYLVCAYQMNGNSPANDPYGDGSVGFNGGSIASPLGGLYTFTTSPSPAYPVNSAGTFDCASFTYTTAATAPPVVNHPVISGGNLILTGSSGTEGAGYTLLTTTNLTPPIIWTTNTTGNFDGSGNFSNAIPVSTSTPATFFRIRTP